MYRLPKIGEQLLADNGFGLPVVIGVIAFTNPHEYQETSLYAFRLNDEDPSNSYHIGTDDWNDEFQGWMTE